MMHRAFFLFFTICFQCTLFGGEGISLPSDYQKNSGLQWEWAIESLAHFSLRSTDRILDIGCGDGKITALIARQVPQGTVVGIDISEKMISYASSTFQSNNLTFLQGNAQTIPFKGQFDKVFSSCVLHWVLEQEQALHSMKEALKQGGMMLLVIPGKARNNLATISEKVARSQKWASFFPVFKQERVYYTLEEYKKLVIQSGLTLLSISETESITTYENRAALIAFIKPLINFIDHLTPELQESFIENVTDEMLKNNPPLPNGSIPVRHNKIEVVALKK